MLFSLSSLHPVPGRSNCRLAIARSQQSQLVRTRRLWRNAPVVILGPRWMNTSHSRVTRILDAEKQKARTESVHEQTFGRTRHRDVKSIVHAGSDFRSTFLSVLLQSLGICAVFFPVLVGSSDTLRVHFWIHLYIVGSGPEALKFQGRYVSGDMGTIQPFQQLHTSGVLVRIPNKMQRCLRFTQWISLHTLKDRLDYWSLQIGNLSATLA